MADLLDVYGEGFGDGGFLSIVALESDAVLVVPDAVCGDWRVMADNVLEYSRYIVNISLCIPHLLTDQLRGTCSILPFA